MAYLAAREAEERLSEQAILFDKGTEKNYPLALPGSAMNRQV
jgi:hypothetical protein